MQDLLSTYGHDSKNLISRENGWITWYQKHMRNKSWFLSDRYELYPVLTQRLRIEEPLFVSLYEEA